MDTQTVQAEAVVKSELAALSHRHITFSYALVGILGLVVVLACLGGWISMKMFDAQLARAEKAEAQYNQDRKDLTLLLTQSQAQRDQVAAQQKVIVQVVHDRNQVADKVIADVQQPKDTNAVISDLNYAYKFQVPATILLDGTIGFPVPQVQSFTATKLDRDRLEANLSDTNKNLVLEQEKSTSLNSDLTKSQGALGECQSVLNAYKKLAVQSKFKKFLSGSVKVLIFVGGIYLGHKL